VREFFPRLLGNEETKARIGRAIAEGTVPHAFLIGGPSGSGKSILATEIAAAINCERRGNANHSLPCGACNTCKRIYEGNFTDVKTLSKKKDKATLGVEPIKDFREDMFLSATESESKIYIIDDAECMTVEAQNALLKVLEEPPRGVFILLLAKECDRILTTIKSRTQYVAMTRFSKEELKGHLLDRSEDAVRLLRESGERLESVLMSADGVLGQALMLASPRSAEENEENRREVSAVIEAIGKRSAFSDIYSAVMALPQKRVELCEALERIISAVRDLIVLGESETGVPVFFASREDALRCGANIDKKRLFSLYDALSEAHKLCQRNANVGNLLVNLAARIKSGR